MNEISEVEVLAYLGQHPDFFIKNPVALESLAFKHDSGGASSFIQYQVKHLQNKIKKLNSELKQLVNIAHDNDRISSAIHGMTLAIMQSSNNDDVLAEVGKQMREKFNAEFCHIIATNTITQAVLSSLKGRLNNDNIFVGRLDRQSREELFKDDVEQVKSVACLLLADGDKLLILGSSDERRYQEGVGTHFLLQIGNLIEFSLQPRQFR